mmetsp:Transcript_70495/g.161741  ORF Transcript_70495/g.161741 Transcript_70495/m.161741 type:complete len:260 (+) Transcript_70495:682-1461(+)
MWKLTSTGPPMMDTRRAKGLRLRHCTSPRRPSSAEGPSFGWPSAWQGTGPSRRPPPLSPRVCRASSRSKRRGRWTQPRFRMWWSSCSSLLLLITRMGLQRGCTGSLGDLEAGTAVLLGCGTGVPCGGLSCCISQRRPRSFTRVQLFSRAPRSTSFEVWRRLKLQGLWLRTTPMVSRLSAPTQTAAGIFSMHPGYWLCAPGWTVCEQLRSSAAWATCGVGRSGRGAELSGRGGGSCTARCRALWRCMGMLPRCCRGSLST